MFGLYYLGRIVLWCHVLVTNSFSNLTSFFSTATVAKFHVYYIVFRPVLIVP